MKRILFALFFVMPMSVDAAQELLEDCPYGVIQYDFRSVVRFFDNGCPAGWAEIGKTEYYEFDWTLCTETSTDPVCWLYAQPNVEYTDGTGIFTFSEICPPDGE